MDRLACVDVAAFPLQLLLRAHPDWAMHPAVVVEEDRPQAPVLFVNLQARRLGVRSGQRYASALAMARGLRAGTVSPSQIDQGVRALADRLRRYSPHVEPSSITPGVFWLDASGLRHLYPSLQVWAELIGADLKSVGMWASVAVGFTRFGVYALAIAHRGVLVVDDAEDERLRVNRVRLVRLNLETDARDRLLALGIETVGQFLQLPGEGIRTRFGAATEAFYQLAAGTRWAPLVPVAPDIHHERIVYFDAPESSVERLIFVIKQRLDIMVLFVRRLGEAILDVVLSMTLDDRTTLSERVVPAEATLEVGQLLTLVRLRLEAVHLSQGIVALRIRVNTAAATSDQRRLLPEQTRRTSDAANQALARLRAEYGEQNVVYACLRDAYLPSARFVWSPLRHVPAHTTPRVAARSLVRRIYAQPVSLRQKTAGEAPDWHGPYVISGGWWGGGVRRDYYFVQAVNDEWLWIYFDHRRQQFFVQGRVE